MPDEELEVPDFMSARSLGVASNQKGILLDIEQLAGALTDFEKAISENETAISFVLRKTVPTLSNSDEAIKAASDEGSDVSMRIKSQRYRIQKMTQRMIETTNRIDT